MRTSMHILIVGAGIGVGLDTALCTTSGRWPGRLHPRRDDEGHPSGTSDASSDAGDAGDADGDTGDANRPNPDADEPLGEGGKRALQAERARAKELEKKLAERDKADEKARLAKLDDQKRAEAERDAEKSRAEKLEADLAVERAARKHGITDDKDLELLAGVPADKVDALARRIAPKKDTGKDFGTDVGGGRTRSTNELPDGFLDKLSKPRTGINLF